MKCLLKYQWVKLPRNQLPSGKGIMGMWARLASRAAFRAGTVQYCRYRNQVTPGVWAGGIVGLKSILGVKRRQQALAMMDLLTELEYVHYTLEEKSKKLTYQITDWVLRCSGEPCMGREAVYATDGYGFLCVPRNITQRLVEQGYHFDEADAWLDLWCHTVWQDPCSVFSHMAPAVQFGQYGAVLTLESFGRRWGWEKTKVWRFFRKYADAFPLYKLPGAFGCLVFNAAYSAGKTISLPSHEDVERILRKIRIAGRNAYNNAASDHVRICRLIAWYGRFVLPRRRETGSPVENPNGRVALSDHNITCAYFSPCEILKSVRGDCLGTIKPTLQSGGLHSTSPRAGPVNPNDGGSEYGRFEGIPLW